MSTSLPTYAATELAIRSVDELLLLLVRNEDRVPRNVIDACAARGDEMLARLEALLHKDYYWSDDHTDGEWWLLLHAVMILGRMADARAGEVLVAFMHRMDEADDETLQEWLSGYWPGLLRNKPDTFLAPLRALAEDAGRGWYMRAAAVEAALAYAQWTGAPALEDALAWAAKLAFDNRGDPDLRVTVGGMLLDLARPQFRRKLEQLADLQSGAGAAFDRQEIARVYFTHGRAPQWEWDGFRDPWVFYDDAAIEERQRQWARVDAELEGEEAVSDAPYARAAPKVGRNDPCPCGSGKKYKKCCLA